MVQMLRLLQVSLLQVSLRPVARRADAMDRMRSCDVGVLDRTVILELDPYVSFFCVVLSGACVRDIVDDLPAVTPVHRGPRNLCDRPTLFRPASRRSEIGIWEKIYKTQTKTQPCHTRWSI